MALTPEEVEKVNDLFRQIDEKETQLQSKEKLITEKEILLNKTRVSLNEKQSILTQKDTELNNLKNEVEETRQQMMCYKDVQQQLVTLTDKVDKIFSKLEAPKTTGKVTRRTTKGK